MKLAPREIIVIAVGGLIVLGAAVYWRPVARDLAAPSSQSGLVDEGISLIEDYVTLSQSLARDRQELKITLPSDALDDQEARMRGDLNFLAQRKGVAIGSIRRVESGAARQGGLLKPIQFQLDAAGPFPALVRFIYALEHSPNPFVMRDFDLAGSGGDGVVQAVMTVQGYLFPTPNTSQEAPDEDEVDNEK